MDKDFSVFGAHIQQKLCPRRTHLTSIIYPNNPEYLCPQCSAEQKAEEEETVSMELLAAFWNASGHHEFWSLTSDFWNKPSNTEPSTQLFKEGECSLIFKATIDEIKVTHKLDSLYRLW